MQFQYSKTNNHADKRVTFFIYVDTSITLSYVKKLKIFLVNIVMPYHKNYSFPQVSV